jgi:hypothetical protein
MVFKTDDGPSMPKHVAEWTLEIRCVECLLDYLHYNIN